MKTTDDLQELFIIVDEKDNVVGYKTRFECHHNKNLIHRVTNIAIFNTKGEILLQKRSMTKDLYPGFFTLSASGHVSKGESYEQAAKREMEEEIGLKNIPIKEVAKKIVESDEETEMLTLYKGICEGPFSFQKDEIQSVKFYSKDEIKKCEGNITPCAKVSLQILGFI